MAGVIKNIISTIFTTSGADAAEGATDRFGRAQTRLGNASAGAGRSFAAQSSGLGGLVGAYAAAAATVFALQAGFTALANAARVEQTFAGLNSLAATVGSSGTQVLNSVRELTNNQLTLAEAASQTSLAFSAGFNTSQIENLTVVALKASRALGRDLSDSMTRVIRGSSKMETELLDELGIYTKIEPATRAYAAAIGKSVGSLSEFERRQAFANAVIAEGQRKFSSINTTIPTTAEQIEAFGVKIVDLTTQLGMLLADTLAPLATFLTNNVAAAFSVLGIAISMAAGKGIQLLSAGFQSMTTSIVAAGLKAENFVRKITGVQAAAITATAAIKTLDVAMLRLNDAEKARLAGIQTSASTRNLSKAEIKDSNALINKSITAIRAEVASENTRRDAILSTLNASGAALKVRDDEFKAARTNLQTLQQQGAGTAALTAAKSQLASAQGRLGAATAAFNKVQANNLTTLAASRTTTLGLNADIATLNTTLAATKAAATGARAGIAGFLAGSAKVAASVTAGFTGLFTGIIGGASKIFFLTSIITLIGSSFANAIGKGEEFQALLTDIGNVFKGLFTNDAATKAKSALQGITAANLANLEKTDAKLRNTDSFTFKKKILLTEVEVTKTKSELATEVTNLLSQASQGYEKEFIKDSVTSGKAIAGAIGGNLLGPLLRFIPLIGPIIAPLLGRTIGTAIGAGLGSIWDYFTEIPDLPKALSDRIKSQFADSLSGLDVEVQDKLVNVLASLEKKYGAAARFDPSARAALKTQQQLVLEGGKYLDDIEAVSELMIATGQTADKLVKNFKFDEGERQISYISQAFTELANKKFTFTFIDIQDEALQKLINTDLSVSIRANDFKLNPDIIAAFNPDNLIPTSLQTSFGDIDTFADNVQAAIVSIQTQAANAGVSIEEFLIPTGMETIIEGLTTVGLDLKTLAATSSTTAITIREPIEKATGAYNSYQQASIRALEVQRQLGTSLADGTATLESFTQGLSNSKSAIIEGEQGYYAVVEQIEILKTSLAELEKTNPELAIGLKAFIAQLEAGVGQSEKNLANQREITKEYAAQEAMLKNQLTISEFFKSFTKQAKNKLSLELEFVQTGNNPLEDYNSSLAYLQQFVVATKSEVDAYNIIKSQIEPLNLSPEVTQQILSTPLTEAKDLADNLNDANKGFNAVVTDTGIKLYTNVGKIAALTYSDIDLLATSSSARIAAVSEDAVTAQQEIVRQAIESLPAFINAATKEYTTLIENANKEIDSITRKEKVAKVKFSIDMKGLQADFSQQMLEIAKTSAEIDYKVAVATPGISDKELATAGNALVESQRRLIEEQQIITMQDYRNKAALIDAQARADKSAIEDETNLQINKISDNNNYVQAITAAALNQGRIIITAGTSVGESILQGFNQGAAVISTALGSFGGAVLPLDFIAPAIPDYEAIGVTAQKAADDYATLAEETTATLYNTEAVKFNEIDTNAQREKAIAAQTALNTLYGDTSNLVLDMKKTLSDIVIQEKQRTKEINDQLALDEQQYKINELSARNDLANTRAQIAQAAMAREIELSNILVDNDEKRLGLVKQQVAFISEALKNSKGIDPQLQNQIDKRVTPYIQGLAVSMDDASVTAAAKKLNEAIASAKPKEINKASLELEAAVQQQLMDKRLALFDQETALQTSELIAKAGDLAARENILVLEGKLAESKAKAEATAIESRRTVALAEVTNIYNLAIAVNKFGELITSFGDILIRSFNEGAVVISDALGLFGGDVTPAKPIKPEFTPIVVDTAGATAAINSAFDAESATLKAATDAANTVATMQTDAVKAQRKALGQEYLDLLAKRSAQREGLSIAETTRMEEIGNQLYNTTNGAGEALEKLTGRLADLKSSIDSSVNSALMGINDAIINGTEENKTALEVLRDAVASIFISIQEEVFKQTIANPISDMISSWLVGGIKQLNLTDIRGSSLAGVLGSARGAVGKDALAKNVMGDKAVEAGAKYFKDAGEKISTGISSLGTGVNAAAGAGAKAVSGAAGVLASTTATSTGAVAAANTAGATTLMSSLGPILAVLAVIAAIGGLFNGKKSKSASQMSSTITTTTSPIATDAARSVPANLNSAPTAINSMPKMAIGGLRDRVPTMLEPGEFVIRKPMVNRIGTPALESLNATGAMPNAAPIINIKNEGSPKDATASPPRFDGEKYVIDIVMRDLANNGPIRKSLRGGAV